MEESEDAVVEEVESSRAHRELFIHPISSNDEDATMDFLVMPSRDALKGDEEDDAEAPDEPLDAEGNAEAHAKAPKAVGSPTKATTGGGGSGNAGAASPKVGVKWGRWAASDE
jgi:hypothetical protein